MVAPGRPATAVAERLDRLAARFPGARLPDVALLGERAALGRLARRGPWSCGGSFRTVATSDGWFGISLPRQADVELVPALVACHVGGDPWSHIADWAAERTTAEAVGRAAELGLAVSGIPTDVPGRAPVVTRTLGSRRRRRERARVVDLTSLWAGPLCAHLLGLCGSEIIKVESTTRPDGARRSGDGFFDLLHHGHRMVSVDLTDPRGIAALRTLIADADLVLEASRARALRQLGIDAEEIVADGTCWLSITAYGRDQNRIGFGDDVAVGAGLNILDGADLLPAGDALADPLTGVTAAVAAAELLNGDAAQLVDVSMHHVARESAQEAVEPHEVTRIAGEWWVESESGAVPVAAPHARSPRGRAGALGADNADVLS